MKRSGKSLAEHEGLLSVIDHASKSAAAAYPDCTADESATYDADFIVQKKREGMSIHALEALIAYKRCRRPCGLPLTLQTGI